jgi:tRNA modification GTPase
MHSTDDTIAAIATAPGRGGIGVIRLSGQSVPDLVQQLLGLLPAARSATLLPIKDKNGQNIDEGLVIYFPAPRSFTGEHVLEIQGHGGPVVLDMLLARVLELGARQARPGEFSERAFLNDKLDLAQAEAIADLIDCSTQQSARAAMRSLQGEFSNQVQALLEQLTALRVFVEAAIDFPEEEIDFLSDGKVQSKLHDVETTFRNLFNQTRQGCLLREGMTLVIAGRPNAGKSSLLNVLSGRDTAIVTPVAGTTRDYLREQIQIEGMPLHLIDTAGLRDSDDLIEQEGVRRSWQQIEQADHVLLLIDDQLGFQPEDQTILDRLPARLSHTLVFNKIDLSDRKSSKSLADSDDSVAISAKTGEGMATLREHLKQVIGFQPQGEGGFSARRRHLDALQRAQAHVTTGQQQIDQYNAGELLAEELRLAQQCLSEITGKFSSDDLLGEIFSSFCIGK